MRYRGMGWGGVNPQDAYAFGCDTAFDQPGPVGFATTLGALYCAISDVYFDSSKTEHITKIEACTFPVKGFEARTSSGTKITNNLPPQGFTCTVKVTAYDCFDPLGVPIGTLIVWNLDFEGVLPENTEIEVELSTDGTSFQPKLTFGVPAAGINYRGGG